MATNFGTKIAITGFVCTIATMVMDGGLSGRPTECKYCRYPGTLPWQPLFGFRWLWNVHEDLL